MPKSEKNDLRMKFREDEINLYKIWFNEVKQEKGTHKISRADKRLKKYYREFTSYKLQIGILSILKNAIQPNCYGVLKHKK